MRLQHGVRGALLECESWRICQRLLALRRPSCHAALRQHDAAVWCRARLDGTRLGRSYYVPVIRVVLTKLSVLDRENPNDIFQWNVPHHTFWRS